MIRSLDWDSRFFGFPIGQILLEEPKDWASIYSEIRKASSSLTCLYIFDPQGEPADRDFLGYPATYVDTKLTFGKHLQSATPVQNAISEFEQSSGSDEMMNLGLQSGEYSRFHVDPQFRPFFPLLYREWVKQALAGKMADKVFVARVGDELAGMATCALRESFGQIGLVATDLRFRGLGIGSDLIRSTENYYIRQNIHQAHIVTQAANQPACGFYKKNGYTVIQSLTVYHLWFRRP